MLEKSFSLLFYLKEAKELFERFNANLFTNNCNGIPKEISTGRQCDPDRWNANAGRCNGTKEDVKSLNAYLDTLQTKVYEVRRQLLDKNETITSKGLRSALKGTNEAARMIMKIFQQHNDEVKSLVGKDFSPATLERYKTSFDHTRSFMEWKYGVSDMDIKKLDHEFVSQYEVWLKTYRNCNHNTTIKYIANFRKIVNRCIRNGWLDRDPFVRFKMTKKEVVPEFLTEHEIQTIAIKRFTSERLKQVRDVFLFCCYTGLAFADVEKLKPSEIGIGIDGSKWIFTNRQKTDTLPRIPLLPFAIDILEDYKNHPACINTEKVLPVLSKQKYNEYLKEIANICGINTAHKKNSYYCYYET